MASKSPHAEKRDKRIGELCRAKGELTNAEMNELRNLGRERRQDPDYEAGR